MLFTHGTSLRAYHLWFPVSTVVLLLLSDQPDDGGSGRRRSGGGSSSQQHRNGGDGVGGGDRSSSVPGAPTVATAALMTSMPELDRRIRAVEAMLRGRIDDRRQRSRLTDELSYLYLQRRCLQEKEAAEPARRGERR